MRSFTTRRKQPELDGHTPILLGRAASQRGGRPVARAQISSPVALVSTTNMLSFNAPDIAGTKPIEHRDYSGSSTSSEESDGSGGSVHSHETDPTDISSAEASPISSEPEPNHLSQFFKMTGEETPRTIDASPTLPRRAPSHSKRAHEALSRKRSVQRARSPSAQGRGISRTRSSAEMFTALPEYESPREPFGKELAQLDAVAEEFGGVRTDAEADAMWIKTRGLACYAASDYLSEIDGLVEILLDDNSPTVPDFSGWF